MNNNYSTGWVINASKSVNYEIKYSPTLFETSDLTLVNNLTNERRYGAPGLLIKNRDLMFKF